MNNKITLRRTLTAIALVSPLAACDSCNIDINAFPGCDEEPDATYCTCGLSQYDDPESVCCFKKPQGSCTMDSEEPPADDDQDAAMGPPNRTGVSVLDFRVSTSSGSPTPAPCEPFRTQWIYRNFADKPLVAPDNINVPIPLLLIMNSIGSPTSYNFPGVTKPVAWSGLDPGEIEPKQETIEAQDSHGEQSPGLDPGAAQCNDIAGFTVQLAQLPFNQNPAISLRITDSPFQPFGFCEAGPSC